MAIVAHYINKNGELGILFSFLYAYYSTTKLISSVIEELLIDFCELVGEHSGDNMAEVIWESLVCFGIHGCVS